MARWKTLIGGVGLDREEQLEITLGLLRCLAAVDLDVDEIAQHANGNVAGLCGGEVGVLRRGAGQIEGLASGLLAAVALPALEHVEENGFVGVAFGGFQPTMNFPGRAAP